MSDVTSPRARVTVIYDQDVWLRLLRHTRAVIKGAGYLQTAGGLLLLLLSLSCGQAPDLVIVSLSWLQGQ